MALCRRLNELGARYVVIGGLAIIVAGHARTTFDVDLLIETSLENEARVFKALEILPDKIILQLIPGEVAQYKVVRVGDEIMVDLIESACGIGYAEASKHVVIREVRGVRLNCYGGQSSRHAAPKTFLIWNFCCDIFVSGAKNRLRSEITPAPRCALWPGSPAAAMSFIRAIRGSLLPTRGRDDRRSLVPRKSISRPSSATRWRRRSAPCCR